MRPRRDTADGQGGTHRRLRGRRQDSGDAFWPDPSQPARQPEPSPPLDPAAEPVARRTPTGWRVGDEEVPDLTSAMVLADMLAAELPTETMAAIRPAQPDPRGARRRGQAGAQAPPDARALQQTVAQLEHALTARVRVEQAIGVLAERHRLRPRQAFELLRSAARARGRRVLEMATDVVDSASNPLLRIPEELAKPPSPRRRGRMAGPTLGNG
jgi:ANTAR domain